VDLLLVATSTPPRATSSLAARLVRALDGRAAAFDVRAGGAGALDAWLTAAALLAHGARSALVVAAETPSRWLDERVPALALLYGDGAGAVLLERDDGPSAGAAAGAGAASAGAPGADLARGGTSRRGLLGALSLSAAGAGRPMTVPGPLPPTAAALSAGGYRMEAPDRDYVRSLAVARHELLSGLRTEFTAEVAATDHFLPAAVTLPQALEDAASLGVAAGRLAVSLREHGALGCAAPLVALASLALSAVGGGITGTALLWRC